MNDTNGRSAPPSDEDSSPSPRSSSFHNFGTNDFVFASHMSLPTEAGHNEEDEEEEIEYSSPPMLSSWSSRQRPNPLQLQVYNLLDDSFTVNEEADSLDQ